MTAHRLSCVFAGRLACGEEDPTFQNTGSCESPRTYFRLVLRVTPERCAEMAFSSFE